MANIPPLHLATALSVLLLLFLIFYNSNPLQFPRPTESSEIPSNSNSESNAELPFPAYVISFNASTARFRRTRAILESLGFTDIQIVTPKIHKLGDTTTGEERISHRACSNKGAHRAAWSKFAASNGDDSDWAFFFEDDIALHPSLVASPQTFRDLLHDAIAYQSELSTSSTYNPLPAHIPMMNLGLCCIACSMYDTGLRITPGTSIELVHTCGRCFHAYGMSRGLSKKLWGLLADGHDTLCSLSAQHKKFPAGWTPEMNFADYVVNENLCSQLSGGGILVVGRNLEARDGGHVGVIWQDRGRFPSIVENTEGGVV